MKIRKLACFLLTILLVSTTSTSVFAVEQASEFTPSNTGALMEVEKIQGSPNSDVLVPLGDSPPGIFAGTHDLGEEDYRGSFSGVVYSIYTDKRFESNSNGYVYLKIKTDKRCIITLHDVTDNSESPYTIPASVTKYIHWSQMDPDHKYYLEFAPETPSFEYPMSGSFTISHSTFQ